MISKKLFARLFFVFMFAICFMVCGCMKKPSNQDYNIYNLQNLTLVCLNDSNIEYDGTPKEVAVMIKSKTGETLAKVSPNIESEDFTIEYHNNINAGTAEVVISAKKDSKYKGTAKVTFTIKPASVDTDDVDELFTLLDNENYQKIYLTADITISENKVLNIPQNKTLNCRSYSLINKGEIINDGFFEIRRTDGVTGFINDGKFVNNNKIMLYYTRIINAGKLENNGEICSIQGQSSLYTNEKLLCDSDRIGSGIKVYTRSSIEKATLTLEYDKKEYTGTYIRPKLTISLNDEKINENEYELNYVNNINKGKASVLVRAKETSSIIFGEKTIYFDIEGKTEGVKNEDELIEKLSDPNYSKLILSQRIINKDIVIGSDKIVCADAGTEFNGKVTIYGILEITTPNNLPVKLNGETIIEKSGQLYNEGRICLKGSVLGQGKALNTRKGKVFVLENQATSIEWENEGSMFINDGDVVNAKGTGNVVTRVCLTANDISIPNNQYDRTIKYPTIDWKECIVPQAGSFRTEVYKKDTEESVSSPKNKGDYIVKVIFREYSELYYGEVCLDYIILPGEITVIDDQQLFNAVQNGNYGKITVQKYIEEIQEFNLPLTINSECELIIDENVKFSNRTTINVFGKIINNGNYAEANIQNGLIIGEQGSFVNNGKAYFNAVKPVGVIGDGVVYIRKDIANATVDYFTPAERIQYTTYAYKPSFKLKFDDVQLIEDVDYSSRYINYFDVSLEGDPAIAIAYAKAFSEKMFGQKRMEYYLLPGEIEVYSLSSLIQALSNVREGTDVCNWKEVNLMVDIKEINDTFNTIKLHVRKNTTLNLGKHKLELRRDGGRGSYELINDGVITAETDWAITVPYPGIKGTGKTVGLIDDTFTTSKIQEMIINYDEIRLCSNITKDIICPKLSREFTIDLCGYTINAQLHMNIEEASIIITSSGEVGTLGSTEKTNVVKLIITLSTDNNNTCTFKNLNIYGIVVYKGSYIINDNQILNKVIKLDNSTIIS